LQFSKLFGNKKEDKPIPKTQRDGEPDVYHPPTEDDRIIWGIEKARLTLHYFEECLKQPKEGQDFFSIKVKIVDGKYAEHIWLTEPNFDEEGNLYGVVGNEPLNVKTVKLNQNIGIDRALVTDWMLVQEGRLIGGYTIRAIREGLTAEDLKRFDEDFGIIIDDGEDYFSADFTTPEGAILCIENAYDEKNIPKILACKDFHIEAQLMAQKKRGFYHPETIHELSRVLELSCIKYFNDNVFPSFTGVIRAFPKREQVSSKHVIITEVVYYSDGSECRQRINTYHTENGWRVLHPED